MKRHIGLLLMICIVFAFFGCQMQENIESQGFNNTLEASSQANNSSCASSSKHDEANSQGSSSEATGISSSSSAIGNIPKPLYSEAFYQKRIESLNTSDAFYNEEYTSL